jgi:sigma-B regulation protein RsbU (phosphoserine phosphatase)
MGGSPPVTARRNWDPNADLLVLFTDGVSDARNRRGERLGEERVLRAIQQNVLAEPKVILERLVDLLHEHTEGTPLRDDLTIVVLRT